MLSTIIIFPTNDQCFNFINVCMFSRVIRVSLCYLHLLFTELNSNYLNLSFVLFKIITLSSQQLRSITPTCKSEGSQLNLI